MAKTTSLTLPVILLMTALLAQIASLTCASQSTQLIARSAEGVTSQADETSPDPLKAKVAFYQRLGWIFGGAGILLVVLGLIFWRRATKRHSQRWSLIPTVLIVVYVFMLFVQV